MDIRKQRISGRTRAILDVQHRGYRLVWCSQLVSSAPKWLKACSYFRCQFIDSMTRLSVSPQIKYNIKSHFFSLGYLLKMLNIHFFPPSTSRKQYYCWCNMHILEFNILDCSFTEHVLQTVRLNCCVSFPSNSASAAILKANSEN